MQTPELVGYTPRNDLWAAYKARFVNSVNTANPAHDIRHLFLNKYDELFPEVPVFIGEYHNPRTVDQRRDLELILDIAKDEATMLLGISFFEFQVRYDKGGSEESFGMFGLDEGVVGNMHIDDKDFMVWCLKPVEMSQVLAAHPSMANGIFSVDPFTKGFLGGVANCLGCTGAST